MLNYAVDAWHVQSVPRFRLLKEVGRIRWFTDEEVAEMVVAVRGLTSYNAGGDTGVCFLMLQVATGARSGETLCLTWEHSVDLAAGRIQSYINDRK